MATINHIEISDDQLHIYVPTQELPDTDFVNQQWMTHLHLGYEDNILDLIAFVNKEKALPIAFTPKEYTNLAELLREQFSYTLSQARRIISWINQYVAEPGDGLDWGTCYLEILEGAHDC